MSCRISSPPPGPGRASRRGGPGPALIKHRREHPHAGAALGFIFVDAARFDYRALERLLVFVEMAQPVVVQPLADVGCFSRPGDAPRYPICGQEGTGFGWGRS